MRWFAKIPATLRNTPLATLLKALIKAALVVLIPFLLLTGLNQFFASENINAEFAAEQQKLAQLLGGVSAKASPDSLFNDLFQGSAALAFPSNTFYKRLAQIDKRYPQAAEFYLFDASARCLNIPGMPMPPKYAAQKFLQAVLDPATGKKNERFLMQFSGYRNAHLALGNSAGSVVTIGSSNDRQWGGWFMLKDTAGNLSGHLIVFLRKSFLELDSLLDRAVSEANGKYGRGYLFAWQDPVNLSVLHPSANGFPQDLLAKLNGMAPGESRFEYDGCPGIKIYTVSGAMVFARTSQPIVEAATFSIIRLLLRVLAICAVLLLLPVYLDISSLQFGLKMRLAALFLFGAGIPLIILVFTGIADRSEREKVLINELQQQSIAELTKIDEGMDFELKKLEKVFRSIILKSRKYSEAEFNLELPKIGSLLSAYPDKLRQILLVRKDWNISFTKAHPEGVVNDKKESMILYGEMLLDVINGDFVESQKKGGESDLQSVVNNFGGWLSTGLIMNSGQIFLLNMLNSVFLTYLDFFLTSNDSARGIMFVFFSRSNVQCDYLLDLCKKRDKNLNALYPRFAAVPLDISPYWPAFPRRIIAKEPVARKLVDQVIRSGIPVHDTGIIGGNKYLLTAIKGKNIAGYVLIHVQHYRLVEESLAVLNNRLLFLTLAVLLIALLAAGLTTRFLLEPLGNLKFGLEAVSSGNFRMQLEGGGVAEFSAMIGSLNRTLASFQELQVARNIQSALWPEEQISGPDWHLHGKCLTATELGDDHFDWIRLGDGRILLIIGDVTGHGIAPAMVQAAIKIWLSMNAEKSATAVDLLREISRLHFNYGAKRLYMTCWVAYFYPDTGKIDFAAAGHPYPFIRRADGSLEKLTQPGMPLGIREKIILGNGQQTLEHGDSLILYTDGIIEVTSRNDVMMGFEVFEKVCQQTTKLAAEESVKHILAAAAAWGPQNDDQTVIVLCRWAKGERYV